ncbi:MAG: hypothetical protein BWY84_01182 [Candidatus Aerophobetes bacterium ADurb.Bin490]|nr:MAG: hypothetical protein BWY84_01182 [Candidatus Aerophobetes bacterium ADurb.Bin490]
MGNAKRVGHCDKLAAVAKVNAGAEGLKVKEERG